MDNISLQEQELRKQIHYLQTRMIELNLDIYKKRFPDEDFPIPQISFSDNFHADAINLYTHSGYPENILKKLKQKSVGTVPLHLQYLVISLCRPLPKL